MLHSAKYERPAMTQHQPPFIEVTGKNTFALAGRILRHTSNPGRCPGLRRYWAFSPLFRKSET